ncbi:MAG: FAD-dependent monooxygenase [Hyphomicrobiaceae bacterium]
MKVPRTDPVQDAEGGRNAVLIAGGGIGGLATALALARHGIASHIFERRAAFSEAGAGIQISPNGVSVLRWLGVADNLEPDVGVPDEIRVRDARNGRVLQNMPLGSWIAGRHGAPYWVAHRRDLQRALVAGIEGEPLVRVTFSANVEQARQQPGSVEIETDTGATAEGPLLVAADGVFSKLRDQLQVGGPPRYSGRTAARTVIPIEAVEKVCDATGVPVIAGNATGVWLAAGCHFVHYPVRGGRELAVVVVRTERTPIHGWSRPVEAREIETVLAATAPLLARALGRGREWRQWSLYEAGPYRCFCGGRVAILGDAAHPTLPFMAQGATLALEDAAVLASELAHGGLAEDAPDALVRYDARRRQRTTRVVDAACRNGHIFHMSGLAAVARNTAMGVLPPKRVMAGYDWIYGWKPPA